nr:flagellar biosynthetic protein FliO [uncultured Cohaesibacter sp.]
MLSIESGVLVQVLIGFGVILILIFLLTWIMKKLNLVSARIARQGEDPRLSIKEVIAIDHKRRLLLVQRDNIEHLLLIGGESDLLVEHHIPPQPAHQHPGMGPMQAQSQPPMNAPQPQPAPARATAPRAQSAMPQAPAPQAPGLQHQPMQPPMAEMGTQAQRPFETQHRHSAPAPMPHQQERHDRPDPLARDPRAYREAAAPQRSGMTEARREPTTTGMTSGLTSGMASGMAASMPPAPRQTQPAQSQERSVSETASGRSASGRWQSEPAARPHSRPQPEPRTEAVMPSASSYTQKTDPHPSVTPEEANKPKARSEKNDHGAAIAKPEGQDPSHSRPASTSGDKDHKLPPQGEPHVTAPETEGKHHTEQVPSPQKEQAPARGQSAPEHGTAQTKAQSPTQAPTQTPMQGDMPEQHPHPEAGADAAQAHPEEAQSQPAELKPLSESASYDDEINRLLNELSSEIKK